MLLTVGDSSVLAADVVAAVVETPLTGVGVGNSCCRNKRRWPVPWDRRNWPVR